MQATLKSPAGPRRRWNWRLPVAGIIGFWVICQVLPPRGVVEGQNPWRRSSGGRPLMIAHGGGQGLNPPNTLEAFEASVRLGCDVLETDLRLTRDGVLVTLHDETIDRTSDGTGRALDFSLAELKQRNFGAKFKDPTGAQPFNEHPARLATLEELFQAFSRVPMVLEIKDRGPSGIKAAETLVRLIRDYQREQSVIVASFDDATLAAFRERSGGTVFTATPMGVTQSHVILARLGLSWFAPVGQQAMQIPVSKLGYRLDFPALIRGAHRRNMAVHYWTINLPDEMKRLIELGADGIMTDRPDLLKSVLHELGYH
jgi:glycerophosphoryl diester phosphodiesterase